MTDNEYTALQQAAQDNQDKRDLARQELGEYLKPEPPRPWTKIGEPETWELLPVYPGGTREDEPDLLPRCAGARYAALTVQYPETIRVAQLVDAFMEIGTDLPT